MDTREWPAAVSNPAVPTNGKAVSRPSIHPAAFGVGLGGLAGIPLGLLAWIWTADWRWATTGLLVMLVALIAANAISAALSKVYRS